MIISLNNQEISVISARYIGKEISIAIDSSKRNTAISIGDAQCRLLDVIELNGEKDGTSEEDTLILCQKQRIFLKKFLYGSKIKFVGIENIITVDKASKQAGISQHMSRFKITAIFMSLIMFFQDNFSITPELVNNQTWKTSVLPKEFTARSIGKGSLAYFKSINSRYGRYTDDATDSICILRYLQKKHNLDDLYFIRSPELQQKKSKYGIFDLDITLNSDELVRFKINYEMTLEDNVIVMANNMCGKTYGVAKVPINYFTYDQIYNLAKGKFKNFVKEVLLIVMEAK